LQLLPVETVCSPADLEVGTAAFAVRIAPACSGFEGVGLFWVFATVYLWLFRNRLHFPHALALIPVGTILIWLCNALRIAALVAVGTWGSATVALGGFHSQAGWLTFLAITLGLVAGSHRLGLFTKADAEDACPTESAAAYLLPFIVVVVAGMISTAFVDAIDSHYAMRLLAGGAVLYYYRQSYLALRFTWSWTAVGIGAAVFVVWIILERLPGQSEEGLGNTPAIAFEGSAWAVTWLIPRLIGYVLLVPVVEELAFRGYLTCRIIGDSCQGMGQFTWFSFLLSSLLFGLFHQGHWVAASVAGMAYALALYRRRQLADAMLAHATTNALLAGYVLATARWSAWG
jgi:exosortase E/protease (VPEID-CTERM system)